MQGIRVSLINDDLLTTDCSIAFIKHRAGRIWGIEKEIDARMDGRLTLTFRKNEKFDHIIINSESLFPFPFLYIINFHEEEFSYSSVDTYSRKIVRLAASDERTSKIATTIHGTASGLDASEALETMLSAFASEIRSTGNAGNLKEILIIEKSKMVFQRLQERLRYLLDDGRIVSREGQSAFLNLVVTREAIALEQDRFESLSLAPVFVAMPFAREYNNVYYFGIKGPVEQRKRKCERMDEDNFTGDIVDRIKERINAAELVIADITGRNPNVFYEIGYAEGVSKKVILLSQDTDLPFDLRTQKHIIYDPQDILVLANKLGDLLDALLNRK